MSIALVTGSSGLIGSEAVKFLAQKGLEVYGIDNNMRQYFFGPEASTHWKTEELKREMGAKFTPLSIDIRDEEGVFKVFRELGANISLVVHTAAQPSHDWAAREPLTDFTVNANGTLVLLEATRRFCPEATFIFTSTNKVYGDTPNYLPIVEKENRWELDSKHPWAMHGIPEEMSIDASKHSLFGASKVAADILTQEYGRYFGIKTGTFRGGCLTGPAHSGAELHGFLAYLAICIITGKPYTIFGYGGKQVRDNIHAYDLVQAFWHFHEKPRPGAVYNIGGSRHSNTSMLEAIHDLQDLTGKKLNYSLQDTPRSGDHIWYISDVRKFQKDYPSWNYKYDHKAILKEIVDAVQHRTTRHN